MQNLGYNGLNKARLIGKIITEPEQNFCSKNFNSELWFTILKIELKIKDKEKTKFIPVLTQSKKVADNLKKAFENKDTIMLWGKIVCESQTGLFEYYVLAKHSEIALDNYEKKRKDAIKLFGHIIKNPVKNLSTKNYDQYKVLLCCPYKVAKDTDQQNALPNYERKYDTIGGFYIVEPGQEFPYRVLDKVFCHADFFNREEENRLCKNSSLPSVGIRLSTIAPAEKLSDEERSKLTYFDISKKALSEFDEKYKGGPDREI